MAPHTTRTAKSAGPLPPGCKDARWLGGGAAGEVYRVTRHGGLPAALKVTPLRGGPAAGLKEFRVVCRITPHRNILEYQEVYLRTADGRFLDPSAALPPDALADADLLILMSLAEQGSLLDQLRDRPGGLPVGVLIGYASDAADALDHLHKPIHDLGQAGVLSRVIHRDVKPANLLLVHGQVKVADYGIARAQTADADTQTGSTCYTPAYAPPELYTNDPVPQSDQYSLAVTYYHLRTGRLPFAGSATAHLLGQLDFRAVGRAERAVLRQATHFDPDRRFPTCRAFVRALCKALGVPPPGTWDPVPRVGHGSDNITRGIGGLTTWRKPTSRTWGPVAALAAGLLVSTAGVGIWAGLRPAGLPPGQPTPSEVVARPESAPQPIPAPLVAAVVPMPEAPPPREFHRWRAAAREKFAVGDLKGGLASVPPDAEPQLLWEDARRRLDQVSPSIGDVIDACARTGPPAPASAGGELLAVYYQQLLPTLADRFVRNPADGGEMTDQAVGDLRTALGRLDKVMGPEIDRLMRSCDVMGGFGYRTPPRPSD